MNCRVVATYFGPRRSHGGSNTNSLTGEDAIRLLNEIIEYDIKQNTYYVIENSREIIGGINIDQNQDKAYHDINWEDNSVLFLVVHRLAVKEEFWNKKIGKKLMLFTEELVREKKLNSIIGKIFILLFCRSTTNVEGVKLSPIFNSRFTKSETIDFS